SEFLGYNDQGSLFTSGTGQVLRWNLSQNSLTVAYKDKGEIPLDVLTSLSASQSRSGHRLPDRGKRRPPAQLAADPDPRTYPGGTGREAARAGCPQPSGRRCCAPARRC